MDRKTPLILILAAGSSSRLGRPKQLLPYKNGTLLSHTIEACISADLGMVRLVLGSNAEEIRNSLLDYPIEIVENKNWKDGMGATIAFGMKGIDTSVKGVLIVLSDQPFLTSKLLTQIMDLVGDNPDAIIVSKSEHYSGPPVCFPRKYIEILSKLSGDEGARSIIKNNNNVVYIDFPNGHIDIDTPDDIEFLNSEN